MKRLVCMIMAAVMIAGLIASCGPAPNNQQSAATTTTAAAAVVAETTAAESDLEETGDENPETTTTGATAAANTTVLETQAVESDDAGNTFGINPHKFDWYINYDWAVDMPWADNKLGEIWALENKLVTVNFMGSGGAAQQRFATMLVDNEYPDVISLDRGQDMEKMVAANALIPLDEWVEGSNLQRLIGDGIINMLRASDGRLYSYPNWAIGPDRYNGNAGWFLNKNIYEELGSPRLDTFDDLYNYLVIVKNTFPDVIPLEGFDASYPFGLGSVVYCGMGEYLLKDYWSHYAVPKDGKLESIYYDENFRDTLLFLNKLYREKLLTQDLFTQNLDQAFEKVIVGRTAVMAYHDAASKAGQQRPDFLAANPGNDLFFIDPIRREGIDLNNVKIESSNRLGWNIAVITKDCSSPASAFAFLDWLFGEEGSRISVLGPPDMYYVAGDYTDEGFPKQIKDAYYDLTPDDLSNLGIDNWVGNTSFVDGLGEYLMELPRGTKDWLKIQQINHIWKFGTDASEFTHMEPDPSTRAGLVFQELRSLHGEAMAVIVMSDSEQACLENIEKYAKLADNEGINELLAFQTEIYKGNLDRLGKPFPNIP